MQKMNDNEKSQLVSVGGNLAARRAKQATQSKSHRPLAARQLGSRSGAEGGQHVLPSLLGAEQTPRATPPLRHLCAQRGKVASWGGS